MSRGIIPAMGGALHQGSTGEVEHMVNPHGVTGGLKALDSMEMVASRAGIAAGLATSLVITGLALLVSKPAMASSSGTVDINGTVDAVCEVSVTDLNASLDLVSGESSKKVATIQEHCNDHQGYTVSFSSSNSGNLRSGDGNLVSYTVDYDGQSRQDLQRSMSLRRSQAQFRQNRDLNVNIDSSTTRVAGAYADTITVTIQAN